MSKIKSFSKIFNNIYFLAILSHLFIILICYLNIFPSGYIFSGADVVQFFNLDKVLHDFKYVWWNSPGEGVFLQYYSYILYYYVIYFISFIFKLSVSGQSFAYFFIFLNGAFFSFLVGTSLFKKEHSLGNITRIILSLIYVFNIYTLYNFYYTWGYSPFLFLYILLPLIFPLIYRFFTEKVVKDKLKYLSLLSIVLFLTNISNGNLSFFISLNIFIGLFILWLYFLLKPSLVTFIKSVCIFYLVYFFNVCWSVLPQIIEMFRLARVINTGEYPFDFTFWVLWQATKFTDLFHLVKIDVERSFTIFNLGILLYLFLFIFLTTTFRKNNKLRNVFMFMLFISLCLLNKGVGLFFPDIINEIFSNPLLITLKSYDKVLVFVPYLLLMSLFFSIDSQDKIHRILLFLLLSASLITSYPLVFGWVQTKYSLIFDYKSENYKTAKYSYLHKIPEDYIQMANLINKDTSDFTIFHAPYSVINSVGWVNYPKWKVVGADPLIQLFNNPSVHMNSFGSFGAWNYGKLWNSQPLEESKWIIPFSGMLGGKYFIYHKDIDPKFYDNTYNKVSYFEQEGLLKKISDTEFFSLYELKSDFIYPIFYVPKNIYSANNQVDNFPKILNKYFFNNEKNVVLKSDLDTDVSYVSDISYEKLSPVKYKIFIPNVKKNVLKIPLVFREAYHSGWFIGDSSNIISKFKNVLNTNVHEHLVSNFYGNMWVVDIPEICKSTDNCVENVDGNVDITFYVEFWPQYLYNISLCISLFSLTLGVSCLSFILIKYARK